MTRTRLLLLLLALVALVPLGCGGGASCTNISGTWKISGACGPDVCVISQATCSTNFDCGSGSESYTGTVSGNKVTYSGQSSTGQQGTCTATVSGGTMSGTCTPQGGATCTFTATKQ